MPAYLLGKPAYLPGKLAYLMGIAAYLFHSLQRYFLWLSRPRDKEET